LPPAVVDKSVPIETVMTSAVR